MYNGNQIKVLLAQQQVSSADLCEKVFGKRDASIWQLVNGNPTAKTLESIADFFKVPIDVFFQRQVVVNQQAPNAHFDQGYFQLLLQTKDELINSKDEEIRMLKKELDAERKKNAKKVK